MRHLCEGRRMFCAKIGGWLVLLAALVMAGPAIASADSINIQIQSSAPEQGLPLTVAFTGAANAVDSGGDGPYLNAVVRPAGGVGCQPTYESDQAAAGGASTDLGNQYGNFPEVGPGAYAFTSTYSPSAVGSYLVCAWLENFNNQATAGPASTTFTSRGPQVSSLSVTLASPARPNVGFQVNYTTQTDQQLALYSIVKRAGGLPCASSYELDQQQNQPQNDLSSSLNSVFGGPMTQSADDSEPAAGPYLICTWIEGPNTGEVDAAQATPIYVGTPRHVRHRYVVRRCTVRRIWRHRHHRRVRVRVRRCRRVVIYR